MQPKKFHYSNQETQNHCIQGLSVIRLVIVLDLYFEQDA